MTSPLINSYTNWSTLQEVWLGDVYPASWYDHLQPEVRDCFYELTENTKHDLDIMQQKLEEFGVEVVRPHYDKIENYIDGYGNLVKPQITPRDNFLVHGNKLIMQGGLPWRYDDNVTDITHSWQHALTRYCSDPGSEIVTALLPHDMGIISGANTVRVGRDIYLDVWLTQWADARKENYHKHIAPLFPDSRVHLLSNGGHIDGCFAVIKPGLLLTDRYFSDYENTFPGWERIEVQSPEFENHVIPIDPESMTAEQIQATTCDGELSRTGRQPRANPRKFFLNGPPQESVRNPRAVNVPDIDKSSLSHAFNEYVIAHALDWVGDYTETFFEVNCLVIDEKNVMVLSGNETVVRALEQHGVTAHTMPFRTRSFWDGGLHCLTLDIRRDDTPVDLFPERDQQLYQYY